MDRDVAHYYDSNTRRFLALGGGARSYTIHRALWGPGVTDAAGAAGYVNVLVGDAVESLSDGADQVLLDLGCGVGGTLFALAERFACAELHGVTISRRQQRLACEFADRLGLASRCSFHHGDFESIDLGRQAQVAIAVESMAHARSNAAFLANAFRHLVPGGTLLIVDDFIANEAEPNIGSRALLDDFRAGWRLPSLTTVPAFVTAARAAGFELKELRDLSPMIRFHRIRDRVIPAIGPLLRRLVHVPACGNLVGGAALTRGLRAGVLRYCWLRLQR